MRFLPRGRRSSGRSVVRPVIRSIAAVAAVPLAAVAALVPSAAQAHSLTSSTISTHVTDDGVDATISIALDTLDDALGTSYAAAEDVSTVADAATEYLSDHLAVTSADGTEWSETYSDATIETVEGIDSFSVDVTFDTGSSDTSSFEIAYDAVIEAVPGHEAVVVLTDASGDVSTAGVITSSADALTVGATSDAAGRVNAGILDMVGYGFHHVLEGADHCCSSPLCFSRLRSWSLPAAGAAGRRWCPR